MTQIVINNSVPVFTNIQTIVLYEDGFGYPYPLDQGVLAPSTDSAKPLYSSGRLLAQYTAAHAPTPALIGAYVNYDPASSNADQAVCVGIIPTGYYNLTGVDLTSSTTASATINNINVCKLLSGVQIWENTIIAQNQTAVVTGFNTQFSPKVVTKAWLGSAQSNIIAIQ